MTRGVFMLGATAILLSIVTALPHHAFGAHFRNISADYSNDSNSVDILYTGGAPTGGSSGTTFTGFGDNGGGSSGTGTGNNDSGGSSSGGDTGALGNSETTVTVVASGSSPGDSSDNGGAGSSGASNGQGPDAGDIIRSLLGNQGVVFGGGGTDSQTITISGAKTRAALAARGITHIDFAGLQSAFLTGGDFALKAASSILDNSSIEEVILSLDTITLTYQAEGRLLAFIPWNYPIKLRIDPHGETLDSRVTVTLPWYSFFLQTFVTRAELKQEIDAAITKATTDDGTSVDAKTRLFVAVTDAIKARFDTVDDSIGN